MPVKPKISFENLEVAFASKSNGELKKMYYIFATMNSNLAVSLGIKLADLAFSLKLPINGIMKSTMFGHFCGGESIEDCQDTVNKLAEFGVKTILDYSVEGKGDEASFEATKKEILRTIERSAGDDNIPFAVFKVTGLGDYGIMTKLQEGKTLTDQERADFERLEKRVDELCAAAYEVGTKILIDAEDSWYQDILDDLVYKAMEKYNTKTCVVYNTYQMYRHDMLQRLKDAHQTAQEKSYFLGAKLVRGAYMEKERERAAKKGYQSPIQPDKASTDRDYNAALNYCMENIDSIALVSGSHNEDSNLMLTELIAAKGLDEKDDRVYFAQLYGMSDNISFNLADAGYNVVKYVPYGPVEKVMPYLSRRAEENTSVAGQSSREFELIKKEMNRRKGL
ncbi:proline dehydrogenase family protein [Cecembia lonarensis]|uniref:Bifunctional proline dehydrogenase/pyrroline-5-carboxylate dehydrogenase n=1 Tax=Cecembia lonarensis (strain CCUG 58316 / KCTC 22772 / LW9) TaxID=1225176 RepID=K1LHY6_CECL9|nr:proline dehydrogenase family protein [Cecembia lonarensis]EKB49878.1 bifunctional proline dehydrogenase/pyrroline-5-carboxylate dehydrogenase [Cecembia lonarensis LW9]